MNPIFAGYMRSFIFGVEDSLVSTVGLLSGIAAAGIPSSNLFVTGTVLIFVEAFSMAVGSFLSERSTEEYLDGVDVSPRSALIKGVIMFFSYFISGFVPLGPYFIFNRPSAFLVSIFFSILALFVLGFVSAKILKTGVWRSGFRMLVIGGIAIGVGIIVGRLFSSLN